ncbi:MAG: glutamate-1-semialdehyde 2,1-aminomutase [Syntrophomonadaceae bacterium]
MERCKSEQLFTRAQNLIPGGVNSPVRAFKAVGMTPSFIKRGKGSKIYDMDNNEFIDYVGSWGPLILGHSYPEVIQAICQAAEHGTSFGAPCEAEVKLAELITSAIPSIEKIRMVNSGTEATMSAIRLARAYTGRNKIIKFEGCYHGHADSFLIKAGSGLLTAGAPSSPGVPEAITQDTLIARYNDLESVKRLFTQRGSEIAAVIVEPVAGNMGLVLPDINFLQGLRCITESYGSILIFDEVISGFRLCYGGFQNICNITPDLTTLGKIIGGGLPVGAYGGRKDIMDQIAPSGEVYQAGTLSGNPLAMVAGITTLNILRKSDYYKQLKEMTFFLTSQIKRAFIDHGVSCSINSIGSMFCIFFTDQDVRYYEQVISCDTSKYAEFYQGLFTAGIYMPPSQFEVSFISCAHSTEDIEKTIAAVNQVLHKIV